MSATLELVLDASGMQRGAQQATKALDDVSAKAVTATTAIANSGRALSSAFQTTGGTIQVAGGIAQTAKAFGELNLAAGAFSASRTLLEIGKTVQDFREMRGAVGATGGAFSVLGGILRAHPLLAIASVISLAATAMSLFSSNTDDAADSLGRLGRQRAEYEALGRVGRGFSSRDIEREAIGRRRDQYREVAVGIETSRAPLSALDLGERLGEDPGNLAYEIGQRRGNYNPAEYLRSGPGGFMVSPQEAVGLIGRRWNDVGRQLDDDAEASRIESARYQQSLARGDIYQFGASYDPFSGVTPERNYVEQSAEDRQRVEEENRKRQEESAQRLASIFEGIGQDIGNVAADLATGSVTFRQAIQSLAQQFLRQGLVSGFGSIASSIGGSFGATGIQANQNRVGGG